jgi:hypothetical protein
MHLLEAYRRRGSLADISDRRGRLHGLASLSKLLVQMTDSACIQYEAIRRTSGAPSGALAAFFSATDPGNALDRITDL